MRIRQRLQLALLSSPAAGLYPILRSTWQIARFRLGRPVTHGDDFSGFARLGPPGGLFLDVGASSGTSAMSFRVFDRQRPILSIEANPLLEDQLRRVRRMVPRFDYRMMAAGEAAGTARMYVPFYNGVPLTGYSTTSVSDVAGEGEGLREWLGDRADSGRLRIEEVEVQITPLDELELDPALVKIDVEGAELSVLRGMSATLERSRPSLLIERSGEFDAVRELLAGYGYAAYDYRAADGRFAPLAADSDHANVFFLTEDALPG